MPAVVGDGKILVTERSGRLRRLFERILAVRLPGMGVQIANRRGLRRIVRIDPMTGFPRVESVNKE